MTRKRIKHEQVPDEGRRNATFEKRANGLLKNANDLSILCGVDMGIVVHRQGGPNNEILWPSPAVFRDRLQKFLDFPNSERSRKMVTHDKYVEQAINGEAQDVSKLEKRVVIKESHQFLNEVQQGKPIDEFDLYQLNGLNSLAEEMLEMIENKENQLNEAGTSSAVPQEVHRRGVRRGRGGQSSGDAQIGDMLVSSPRPDRAA